MKTYLLIFLAAAIVVNCSCEEAVQVQDDAEAEKNVCNDQLKHAMQSIEKNTEICTSEAAKRVESLTNAPDQTGCIFKCVFEKENIVEEDGTVTSESFMRGIDDKATGPRREYIQKLFNKCNKKYGSAIKADDAESCPGYEKFGVCLQKGVAKICNKPKSKKSATPKAEQKATKDDESETAQSKPAAEAKTEL